ncbi:TPA: DUF551 domain-containing protein [Escherichia coli]|nr:DUF551 domain-containing protein [Escherichia coli]
MTTMNREEQKQVLIDTANHIIHRDNTSPYSENLRELARIALAALEVEPIGFRCRRNDNLGDWSYVYHREPDDFERKHLVIEGIYAAPPAPIALEAIENAIEYIRSIAFHIDEDDYHGKHIAYFMRQALAWLEGHSCSDDRLGKADNQPVRGNQAAESNRGNEWTGNPDIDNAIIMLDRIDTAESYDDDRIEAVKAVLRRLAGNSPVTPDGWISCSERMPEETGDIIVVSDGIVMSGISYSRRDGFYIAALKYDDDEPIGGVTHWMPLPEPPQGVNDELA